MQELFLDTEKTKFTKEFFRDLPFWIWDIKDAIAYTKKKLVNAYFHCSIRYADSNLSSQQQQQKGHQVDPIFDEKYILKMAQKLLMYHNETPDQDDRYSDGVHCDSLYCCFNHIIGLPKTHFDGRRKPLFGYQKKVIDSIRIWLITAVLKAKKLGITELILKLILYICSCLAHNYSTVGNRIVIVTGTRFDLAKLHMDRIRNMMPRWFKELFISKDIENLLVINDISVEIYPSKNIKDLVGLVNVIMIFVDEADFFNRSQTFEINDTIIPYADALKTKIIMVSTPNLPHQYFYNIFVASRTNEKLRKEYERINKIELDWSYGKGRIYPPDFEETELVKSYAKRAYLLQFLGEVGNAFNEEWIEHAIALGQKFENVFNSIDPYTRVFVGEDTGYSSGIEGGGRCARTIAQLRTVEDTQIGFRKTLCFIYYSKEQEENTLALDFARSGKETFDKYGKNTRYFVDGSDKNYIKTLKTLLLEDRNYEMIPKEEFTHKNYYVLPIYTSSQESQKLKEMYRNLRFHLMHGNIAIRPQNCDDLISALYSANVDNDVILKKQIAKNHALDSCLLMMEGYDVGQKKFD